jgi:hypothetical protein
MTQPVRGDKDPSNTQLYYREKSAETPMSEFKTANESTVCQSAKLLLLATKLAAATDATGSYTSHRNQLRGSIASAESFTINQHSLRCSKVAFAARKIIQESVCRTAAREW